MFAIDNVHQRLIGQQLALDELITVDLNTFEQKIIRLDTGIVRGHIAYSEKDENVYKVETLEGNLRIVSIDPITGHTELKLSTSLLEPSSSWLWFSAADVDFAEDENALYILVNYFYDNQSHQSRIFKYDILTGSLSNYLNQTSLPIYTRGFAHTNDGVLIME